MSLASHLKHLFNERSKENMEIFWDLAELSFD